MTAGGSEEKHEIQVERVDDVPSIVADMEDQKSIAESQILVRRILWYVLT